MNRSISILLPRVSPRLACANGTEQSAGLDTGVVSLVLHYYISSFLLFDSYFSQTAFGLYFLENPSQKTWYQECPADTQDGILELGYSLISG